MPHDFWNYGINPIVGFRYMPDGKARPDFMKRRDVDTNTNTTP